MKTVLLWPYQCGACGFVTTSVESPTDWKARPGDTMNELLMCRCGALHVFGANLLPRPITAEEQAALSPEDLAAVEAHRATIRTLRASEVRA